MVTTCRICHSTGEHPSYLAREMMFGFRDEFRYFTCSDCGCLQIEDFPDNLGKYYPSNYYSYFKQGLKWQQLVNLSRKCQEVYRFLGVRSLFAKIVQELFNPPALVWSKKAGLEKHHEILDVGSGAGKHLCSLRKKGFHRVTGVDPFVKEDIFYESGVSILKKSLMEIDKSYDFIILNHSFEHMWNPEEILRHLYKIVRPNRFVLVRIPTSSSLAWHKYRANWVQLDAPRHFYLHSLESMKILASRTGFKIEEIEFDSTEFQFWGSEQYARNISLTDDSSFSQNPRKSIFTKRDMKCFRKDAIILNTTRSGDQASFYLLKD